VAFLSLDFFPPLLCPKGQVPAVFARAMPESILALLISTYEIKRSQIKERDTALTLMLQKGRGSPEPCGVLGSQVPWKNPTHALRTKRDMCSWPARW